MNKNYLVLNGKCINLTKEQIDSLNLTELDLSETINYKRVNENKYYYIDFDGALCEAIECNCEIDENRFNVANYCTNYKVMKQRALHEKLNRLLWRFSMENNGDKIEWGDDNCFFKISYNHDKKDFVIDYNTHFQNLSSTYFHTKEIAQRAIEEVIKPFIEEHQEFIL